MDEKKEKSAWDHFKDGFKPTSARAKESVQEDRIKHGNQLELDMKKSKEERLKKIKDGFFSR